MWRYPQPVPGVAPMVVSVICARLWSQAILDREDLPENERVRAVLRLSERIFRNVETLHPELSLPVVGESSPRDREPSTSDIRVTGHPDRGRPGACTAEPRPGARHRASTRRGVPLLAARRAGSATSV